MLSKQIDKDVKMYSGPPASMPNNINNIPLSKAISQKMEKIRELNLLNNNYQNKGSSKNVSFRLKSEKNLRKKKSLNENIISSKFYSKTNLSNNKKRKSIGEHSSKKHQYDIRNNSSSFIKSSDKSSTSNQLSQSNTIEDAIKISNNDEEKNNNESIDKISFNNNNNENNIENNNENSNFDRIEEEESSNNSRFNYSDEDSNSNNNNRWTKKFKYHIFNKFKKMVKIINQKKRNDYRSIIIALRGNEDDKIYEVLADVDFKKFYRNKDNLFAKDVFMDEMVKNKKFELLKKISKDPYYEFDKDYIFDCFFYCIAPRLNEDKKKFMNKNKRNIICKSFDFEFFNNINFMGELLEKYLKTKQKKIFRNINDVTILEIISGLVENGLYDNLNFKKIRIIFWLLATLGLNNSLPILIKNNEKIIFNSLKKEGNDKNDVFSLTKIYKDIINQKNLDAKELNLYSEKYYLKTIEDCLSCELEDLAMLLANLRKPYPELIETYKMALKHENMMYLKYMWEKSINYNKKIQKEIDNRILRNRKRNSLQITYHIDFSEIINMLIKNNKEDKYNNDLNVKIKRIFEWKDIEQETSLLKSLFENNCFRHICYFLRYWPQEKINKEEYFKKAIEFKQKELILFYLNKPEIRNILYNKKIQKLIVNEYIPNGELFYYGAECLSYIYKKKWDINLTKNLCSNITKIIKTKDILNCHSPILTCLLLLEFIKHIRYLTSSDIKKCTKVLELLISFCQRVQESIHDESSISYLMNQKDTRDRTVFQIVSNNKIYELLETPEIGTVIKKMRDGVLNANGIRNTSSLHRFLFNDNKLANPFNAFQKLNPNKVYFFQLNARLDGCNSRINETCIFSIILAFVYQFYIYILNEKEEVLNNFEEISHEAKIVFYLYIILVHILIYSLIIEKIFLYFSKRKVKFESWDFMDFFLLIFSWLCILDTKKFTGEYADDNIGESIKDLIWSIQIPVLKNLEIEDASLSTQVSFWIRIVILAINDIIVWSRVTRILLYYRQIGPVIRTIFTMGKILIKYIFIIIFFMACCAGIFTCIFNRHSSQFVDFSTSVISLFGAFLNDFNCYDFDTNYKVVGSIILLIYVCIASVLFINLLIVIISHGFQKINRVVESSHRAVLIQYCKKFKWHKKFGYLIFLSPPFNLLILPPLLLNLFCSLTMSSFKQKDNFEAQKKFNMCITKFIFSCTYFPYKLFCFTIYSIVLIPFAYIKGAINMILYLSSIKNSKIYKFYYIIIWFFFGILFIFSILLRDIYYCFYYMFTIIDRKDDEFLRKTKNLTDKDVLNIFRFIHSPRAVESRNDVHSMFVAFLDFEKEENELENKNINGKNQKLKSSDIGISKSPKKLSKKDTKKEEDLQNKISTRNILIQTADNSGDMTTKIRKNLMLIETLENFTFNDDSDTTPSVNLSKMRKLLPLVYNIKKKHINRLVFSHVSIMEAMSKTSESKINFRQYLLTKQIIECAANIDKQIDVEITKLQNKMRENQKMISSKRKGHRRNSVVKIMNTFIMNNKGSIIDENNYSFLDDNNKKNIVVEMQSVKDFFSVLQKIKNTTENIINKKDNE